MPDLAHHPTAVTIGVGASGPPAAAARADVEDVILVEMDDKVSRAPNEVCFLDSPTGDQQ
ncbi:hypothetical protein QNN03_21670 [Streptomyces sp. GXMU-J15]|uniref:Uncharacterized protein n=1 Tax=Streptomyces fuscus TaxID=3048495 RepID=A0ABT7J677_9ACTN|nr:hypothetical protein [Streptomyces fuscus]MDL2079048.1 hypothetical protein [Streptomyces fuscus]